MLHLCADGHRNGSKYSELLLPSIVLLLPQLLLLGCCCWCLPTFFNDTFFCGIASQRGPRHLQSWGFYITYNDASQSVRLLWTSDQLVAQTSDNTPHHDKHPCPGEIRNHNLNRRAAAELCFRQADLSNTTSKFRTVVMFVSRDWSKHLIQRLWSMNLFCLHIKLQCFIPHRYNRQLQKMFMRPPSCYS